MNRMATHAVTPESPFAACLAMLANTAARAMDLVEHAHETVRAKAERELFRREFIAGATGLFQSVDNVLRELSLSYDEIPFDRMDAETVEKLTRHESYLYSATIACMQPTIDLADKWKDMAGMAEVRDRAAKYLADAQLGRMTDQQVFAGTPERSAYLDRLIGLSVEEVAAGHTEPLLPIP